MKINSISVVCPTYNEEKYIDQLLDFFEAAEPSQKEIFIIDGGSFDNTREIVKKRSEANPKIQLLENPNKYVPYALNMAIPKCSGDIIIRLDAHTKYASDYFLKIMETFEKVDADIVGGPMNPVGVEPIQKAVAIGTSNSFGIGNSQFHNVGFKGYTDSVYLGAWKREIFQEVGLFDEQMVRNQDDEFHYRAKSKGKKIYLNPEIQSWYFPRSTFKSLFKQYFQYGLYKPLVIKKVKSEVKIRHLIPAGFVLYFIMLASLGAFFPLMALPLGLYLLLDLWFSLNAEGNFRVKILSLLVYPTLHISYGSGFLLGLFRKEN